MLHQRGPHGIACSLAPLCCSPSNAVPPSPARGRETTRTCHSESRFTPRFMSWIQTTCVSVIYRYISIYIYMYFFNSMALSSTQLNRLQRRKNTEGGNEIEEEQLRAALVISLLLRFAVRVSTLWRSDEPPSGAGKAVDKSRRSQHQRAANTVGPPCRVQLEGAINTAAGQGGTGRGVWSPGTRCQKCYSTTPPRGRLSTSRPGQEGNFPPPG